MVASVETSVTLNFPSYKEEQYRSLISISEFLIEGVNLSLNATACSCFVQRFNSVSFVHWKVICPVLVMTLMFNASENTLMQFSNVTIRGLLSVSLSEISSRSRPCDDRAKSIT